MKVQAAIRKPVRNAEPPRRKPRPALNRARNELPGTMAQCSIAIQSSPTIADASTLLAQAAALPSIALPHQGELEARFGRQLDQIAVYANPPAQAALAALHAEAVTHRGAIFLADPHPPLELVAHEVVHALQMGAGIFAANMQRRKEGRTIVVAAADPAEREAATLAAQVQRESPLPLQRLPLPVMAILPPAAVALRRTNLPAPPTDAPATEAFRRNIDRERRPAPPAPETPQPAPAPPPAPSTAPPTIEPDQPPFELPPAPAPGVSEADVAAREAEQAQAEAALAAAEGPEDLMAAFAAAPPTVKAQRAAMLGAETDRLAKEEQAAFSAEPPDLHAELNTQVETPPSLTVAPPDARPLDLDVEGTLPQVALPPTPDPGRYAANDGVTADVSRLMSGESDDRAAHLAERLREVNTRDSEIVTSPGAPPRVPLTEGADPAQLDEQITEGVAQSRQMRDEAAQAVINGPGPEQAQPIALDEAYPVGELAQPEIAAPQMPAEPQAYLEMGLPPEVQTAFDQQQQAAMEASLAEARTQADEASAERDRQRAEAVADAQAQAQEQSAQADEQQRAGVIEARERIQDARQETLEAQQAAVTDIEQRATAERTAHRREIDERVRADEAQIEQHYEAAERDARAEVADGERQAEAERQRAEREAEEQSWWDRAVNFVRDAFAALTRVIGAIFDAVRQAVNAILDAAKALAMQIIDAAAAFVNSLIAAFGELLKGLVDALIGDIFPELAARLNAAIDDAVAFAQSVVTAAAEGLKAGIAALVEGLRAGLNAIINIYQAAVQLALAAVQAALTGDWAALARMALEAVLKVAGIDPEAFYQFIGRAQETFQLILDDPGGFVGHLVDAFLEGVRRFADNFLTHLQAGIIGWLTGALGGAGITLPERFDLMGVLSLIQQILGLTWERLRERAVRLIGERAVAVIEFVADYLRTLIEGGWEALWQRIRDDLSSLRDMVLEGIKSFLLERIVMAAITRLATMFNPVGAIVNLILAAYNLFTFLRDQLARIIEVVQTVVNAIGDIARGIIQPAAQRVEETLARLLPLAIDLLARLLGLGNVGNKVREIIERVRGVVDRALDRLIDRVRNMFRGGGAAPAGAAAGEGDVSGQVRIERPFTMDDTGHSLFVELHAGQISVEMSSRRRRRVEEILSAAIRNARRARNKELVNELSRLQNQLREIPLRLPRGRDARAEINNKITAIIRQLEGIGRRFRLDDLQDIGEHLNTDLLKQAVESAGIVEFMNHLAHDRMVNGVDRRMFSQIYENTSQMIGNKTAREWIKDKFRRVRRRTHEWIPTHLIHEVIDRAASASSAIEATKWIDLQNELRTETNWVIFKREHGKEVTVRRNVYLILMGHPGAIYLDGEPQVDGSDQFHRELGSAYQRERTIAGLLDALKRVFERWVWSGRPLGIALHPRLEWRRPGGGRLRLSDETKQNALKEMQRDRYNETVRMFDTLKTRFR